LTLVPPGRIAMKCPGQDTQYWTASAIFETTCPQCGKTVEFFKDDTSRKCGHCGHRFVNPKMDFGCAAYCSFAEQCLGDLPPELVAQKEDLLKDRVAVAVKRRLKSDFKRIGRASRRARHVEELGKAEQANLPVMLMAAYLWDLLDSSGDDRTAAVRDILSDLKAPAPMIEQVCLLITGQGSGAVNGDKEAALTEDAAAIALLEEEIKDRNPERDHIGQRVANLCRTTAGRAYAEKLFNANRIAK
jgi:hypothetical protein